MMTGNGLGMLQAMSGAGLARGHGLVSPPPPPRGTQMADDCPKVEGLAARQATGVWPLCRCQINWRKQAGLPPLPNGMGAPCNLRSSHPHPIS